MALQFSVGLRNARLEALTTVAGSSAVLRIYSGTIPANCAAAITGTLLAELFLPATWMTTAAAGVKSLVGTWQDASANAAGTASHFRIWDNGLTTCHMQGTVGTSGTDMIVDSTTFTGGQQFTVTALTLTEGNA